MTKQQHATRNTQHEQGNESTIKKFTDLKSWQEAHKLVLLVQTSTKTFPEDEKFGLTSQMRRAAVSITSDIAEGFGRRNAGEKIQFYSTAQASISEIQNQLLLARDLEYSSNDTINDLQELSITAHKLLTGLIRSLR